MRAHTKLRVNVSCNLFFYFFFQCPVPFPFQMVSSMAVSLQMPQNDNNFAWIFAITEQLLQIIIMFANKRSTLRSPSLDSEFLWELFLVVIANQRGSVWAIKQSDCEKVINNACSFFVSRSWSRSLSLSLSKKKKNKKTFPLMLILW